VTEKRQSTHAGELEPVDAVDWWRHIPAPALLLDRNGVVRAWNDDAGSLFDWTPGTAPRFGRPGVPWFDRLRERTAAAAVGVVVITRRRARRRALSLTARDLGAGVMLVLAHDVTPLTTARRHGRWSQRLARQAEAALRTSHERIRLITESVQDHATFTLNFAGLIASWNAGAERVTGFAASKVMHRPLTGLLTPGERDVDELLRVAETVGREEAVLNLSRPEGSTWRAHVTFSALYDAAGRGFGTVVVLRDLTEAVRAADSMRRIEEQLQNAQKMDAIGRLASGIAHDFNNLLTIISGHVNLLINALPADAAGRDDADAIRRAGESAAALTHQLLTFARRQVITPEPLDLNHIVRQFHEMARRVIPGHIKVELQLAERLPRVFADTAQIEQVLMNLLLNARDAIGDRGGTIILRTGALELDTSYATRGLQLTPGEYAQLTISDTGSGMSKEVQRHVFEPFFTTKVEGTGIGLSTVYGIIKQLGGHVSVYSEPNVGTTFKLFIPLHGTAVAAGVVATERPAGETLSSGTVLLVEDDQAVRGLARRTLEGSGFSVLEAAAGDAALHILREHAAAIEVVVTDVNMPGMSGHELAARVREVQPRAGVVLMSGFPEEESSAAESPRGRRYLEKPFTPVSLVRAVREAMGE
jgi:two-component system, cell cycle sensor histidine kinase and response regulator CckA